MRQQRRVGAGGLAAVALTVLGCNQGESVHGTTGVEAPALVPPSTSAATLTPRGVESEALPGELVEIKPPAGWTSSQRRGWTLWASGDQRAKLALAVLDDPKNTAAKRQELEEVFGVSEIRLTDPQALTIGADRVPAQAADGACHFASGDGSLAFAALDAGGTRQVVLAYAFEKDAPAEAREQAMAAVASLRKKR